MRRLPAAGAHREIRALWALLTAAAVLRVLGAVMETRGVGPERYWPMAVGGVFAMTALIAFAVSIIRAARVPPPEIRLEVKDR